MAKIEINPVPSGFYTTVALNNRFQQIEEAFNDKVLWRDNPIGEPNQMSNLLDMADYQIINLPAGVEEHEPVTVGQVSGLIETQLPYLYDRTLRTPDLLRPLPAAPERINKLAAFDFEGQPVVVDPSADTVPDLALRVATLEYEKVQSVETIADLKNQIGIDDGRAFQVLNEPSAGLYQYSAASTLPSAFDVVVPNDGIGRYLKADSTSAKVVIDGSASELGSLLGSINDDIDALVEQSKLSNKALTGVGRFKPVNAGFNSLGAINVIGDSISHGAFAGNLFLNGWTRILGRMINAEYGGRSYGYEPYLSLGTGPTASSGIHSVSFTGSWGTSPNSGNSVSGLYLRETTVGSKISFSVPFFQNAISLWWADVPGGCTFTVSINGTVVDTINTNAAVNYFRNKPYALSDAGYGVCTIEVTISVAGTFDFGGIAYNSGVPEVTLNNLSQSGRKLAEASAATLTFICQNSATLLMCLGHNDVPGAALTSAIDTLIAGCNANNVKLYVCDFRWSSPDSDPVRQELKRLAESVTNATYIPFPNLLRPDGVIPTASYLINDLQMWVDGSHPNADGNKLIAETVASYMGLSCTSKKQALEYFDYWFPLQLIPATSVENGLPASIGTVSAFKRSGSVMMIKGYLNLNSTGSFPVGTYNIQASWPAKSAAAVNSLAQGNSVVAVVRDDTGAIVSTVNCTASGAITLKVLDGTWINDQIFSMCAPI